MNTPGRSLTATFTLVWAGDPALDFPATVDEDPEAFESAKAIWAEYQADGDHAKLPIKPGMELAQFTCKPLSMRQRAAFMDIVTMASGKTGEGERVALAKVWIDVFAASVRGWSGGFMASVPQPVVPKGAGGLTDATLDELHLPVVLSIGARIFELARLGP